MPESVSITAGIASRYATALFDLAKEADALTGVESDLDSLAAALDVSPDLAALIESPVYTRDEQSGAMVALARRMGLSELVTGALGVMAENRRLFVLPKVIELVRAMMAAEKGEVTAKVSASKPLTAAQKDRLTAELGTALGDSAQSVRIEQDVDEGLVGGLVIRVGSRMVDSSIRSRLSRLQNAMKEVG
ncbi:MAG: F0F1 ATP synthase subunit delta [Paracoccaceae bacterium]|nr:F0F1 ATP synthase subunit delta [Paracoccaceae bacterium]MDE2914310.1 F0F1 ATP synthase subunit delta [Paracoccaceae bacterium]